MGLNDFYQSIRSQILLMNLLPSVNQAYSMISQEEAQCSISSSSFQTSNYLLQLQEVTDDMQGAVVGAIPHMSVLTAIERAT